MVYARAGFYKELQPLIEYDFSIYLDLEFDSMEGWDDSAALARLDCMIEKNSYVIKHAREVWVDIKDHLHQAATKLPENIYRSFSNSLNQIK